MAEKLHPDHRDVMYHCANYHSVSRAAADVLLSMKQVCLSIVITEPLR